MQLTVILHIWNERFLLPYWLKHHLPLFDHGVIIDYASNDGSVEIARELAPHWEVRPSRNRFFRASDVDREVMDIEREFDGWKLAMNVTEFVFHPDLRELVSSPIVAQALALPSVVMCDLPHTRDDAVDDRPLWQQKRHGYWDNPHNAGGTGRAYRYLHRAECGRYGVGRHVSGVPSVPCDDAWLLWFGWAPLAHVTERKLQIKQRIPTDDKMLGHGRQHQIDLAGMEAQYAETWPRAVDLWSDARYVARMQEMEQLERYEHTWG